MLINKDWSSNFLDQTLPWWREKRNWIPLYLLLLIFVLIKLKKQAWLWILGILASVGLADLISSHLLKPNVGRLRPCHPDSAVAHDMILRLSNCPPNGSFTSSHAANHFALAFFIIFTMQQYMGIHRWWFFLWAAIICWAQVYVGVHYPGDIAAGAVLGSVIAWGFSKSYFSIINRMSH